MKPGLFSVLVFVSMVGALSMVFLYAPTEQHMGPIQRIFYFHVPSAITAFVAFFLVFVGSLQYLRTRKESWDRLAHCAAELGVVFSLIVLITGPLWAKPIWGAWWRWEPRLTSMLVLFTLYVGYLMIRAHATPTPSTRRLAAVVGILGFVNVPLVHYSVHLWSPQQQLHPQGVSLEPAMLHTKYVSYLAILLLFFWLLRWRLALEQGAEVVAGLRVRAEQGSLAERD